MKLSDNVTGNIDGSVQKSAPGLFSDPLQPGTDSVPVLCAQIRFPEQSESDAFIKREYMQQLVASRTVKISYL